MQQQRPLQDMARLNALDSLPTGQTATVSSVHAPAGQPEWAQQLEDLGFVAGERVSVLTRGVPGGDPLVVRVGLSTYALRKAEAGCVQLQPQADVLLQSRTQSQAQSQSQSTLHHG